VIVRWGLAELSGVLDVRAHAEIAGVKAAREAAGGADGLIALGGGSAIDTAKAVSSETGLPIVSIPTTYSGAEGTSGYAMRDPSTRAKLAGGGAPPVATVYTTGRTEETDTKALLGAPLISQEIW
jgi:maleylacetate reductase